MPSYHKKRTREALSDPKEETLEAPSDPDEETQDTSLDPKETQKAPPNPEGEVPSDPGVETKDVARLAEGLTGFEGLVVPARRKLTISGNCPLDKYQRARIIDGCPQASEEQRRKHFYRRTRKATRRVCQYATAGAR